MSADHRTQKSVMTQAWQPTNEQEVCMTVAQGTPRTDSLFTEKELSWDKGLPSKTIIARLEDHARQLEAENAALSAQLVEQQRKNTQLEDMNSAFRHANERYAEEYAALEAEIMDARSLAFNLTPERTEEDASSDLCEQIDLLGKRLSAQVAELQQAIKERGLFYAGREACILNARDAHQQRADRAEAQVVELQKVLIYARGALVEVSPCMNPECEQIQTETLEWAIKKLDVSIAQAQVPPSVKDSGT